MGEAARLLRYHRPKSIKKNARPCDRLPFHGTTERDMENGRYRIGELARKAGVTVRAVRYYESLGLLKTQHRSDGGQRYYSDADLVYIARIIELKNLDFSLEEIGQIIRMGNEDSTGELRRLELLKQYRSKLSEALERKAAIEQRVDELSWHVNQLESAGDAFQRCPGSACATCQFAARCTFQRRMQ